MNASLDAIAEQPITTPIAARPRRKSGPPQSPTHKAMYYFFNKWARNPEQDGHYIALRAAMRDHELKERLRRAMPSAS